MRIRQLDLLRYGHFTGASIALPAITPDIHGVLGENEAGKSTAMAGIEDLLFGIPSNSPRNFLHEYGAMRIGATLEKGVDTLTLRRRKGNKDTLLSEQDMPLPSGEGALAPYLAGADRRFYTRMFSLDHERLRQGGREILRAQDDIGQMLFSASAGVAGLRESLKAMEAKADALWASRRAAHRKYFQAEERLKSAETSMRDHIVTTAKWQLLKSAFETANNAYQTIEQEIEAKSAELRRLIRIRRVCRDVRKRAETETAIHGLGPIIPFVQDTSSLLEKAAKDDADAASRITTLNEQIAALKDERATLTYDQILLLRADDIQQLHDRRIQSRAGKSDLPKRRAELTGAQATLNRLAVELEWAGDVDQLIARIPARAKIATLRTVLNRRGEQLAAVQNAKVALADADDKLAELATQIEALGTVTDVSSLAAVIKATREIGDIGGHIGNAKRDAEGARVAIDRSLKFLRPAVADHETLESMAVPPMDSVEAHRDACRNLEQRSTACAERVRTAGQELARHRKAYERIASAEQVVAPDELQRLRSRRDTGWSIIRRRHVDGIAVPQDEALAFSTAEEELPQAFEAAMRDADNAADRRFEKSEAAARLAVIARQINEQNELLESLACEDKGLAEERAALDTAWNALWAATPVARQDPDTMIQWLRGRSDIINLIAQLSTANRQMAAWQGREVDAKRLVQAEFDALGLPSAPLASQPLHVVIESAAAVERTHEGTAKARRDLDASQRKAASDAARRRKALESAELEWKDWTTQWGAALEALQLPVASAPETADAQINAIDDMREAAVRINDLRHERIEKIERDIRAFEHDVAALLEAVAPQLGDVDAEDAVLGLERRVAEAKRIRDLAGAKDSSLKGLQEKIDECHESCREAREVIRRFLDAAGVETIDALRIAIRQSDEMRQLRTEFDRLTDALAQDGDGLSIAALNDECGTTNLDEITAKEQTVTQEVNELRDRLMEARENRSNARREFEAKGGDDRAARDAADRQAALAEISEIAEQYVRLRSGILLLQWAIDRYRREKQAPLLKRAGELFAILTGGSFQTLRLEFDADDNVELAGIRQDGRHVTVAGMSDGTVDQLYLALRIAAMEDYLDNAEPMPFIADDLFINFDDKRAAAGFRVLNELAKKTQVLFFTHHKHLLDVARDALGTPLPTVTLPAIPVHTEPGPARSEAA
jgi:uncharacterized protein YhaN